jgi:adenylate cyclase
MVGQSNISAQNNDLNLMLSNSTAMLYENILASMDNGVIALDFEGKIITFNAAASKILGIDAGQALGKYYPEVFFQLEGNDEFNDVLIHVIDTRQTHFYREVSYVRNENRVVPLGITSSLLKDEQGNDYGVVSVFTDLTEIKKRQFLQDTLTRYVTKQVVDLILDHPETIVLDGEEREATILFSDIRGFTSLSEKMPPKELVKMLRDYFTLMVGVVFQFQGTIDKFIGDAIMSIFGAPTSQPNHAELAVQTALEMWRLLDMFNAYRVRKGQEPIDIGVGISTGKVVVGNIGSEERLEYTAIGDTVNLASRLEGVNKLYGTHIIISEYTYHYVKDSLVERELDEVRVKGKHEPVIIYEVMGNPGEISEITIKLRDRFAQGLVHYRKKEWDQAITQFQQALQLVPSDVPSRLYIDRCIMYKQNSPPDDWDGVFEIQTK